MALPEELYTQDTILKKFNMDSIEIASGLTFKNIPGCQCVTGECNAVGCNCDALNKFCVPNRCACSNVTLCAKTFAAKKVDANQFKLYTSTDKGLSLHTTKQIQANAVLFEYTGILDLYRYIPDNDYLFSFEYDGKSYVLDAGQKGNLARFCNHSCAPNCYTRLAILDDSGAPHVIFCSYRPIKKDEELTIDYGIDWWQAKYELICACGSEDCKYTGNTDQDIRLKVTAS